MAGSSGSLHEPAEHLSGDLIDRHRAIVSIMEELEAIDWYDQRVAATNDPDLAAVLAHNRDEEKEHAAMTLEWLRRQDPALDTQLRRYLFTSRPVVDVEGGSAKDGEETTGGSDVTGSLGIGSLRSNPGESL